MDGPTSATKSPIRCEINPCLSRRRSKMQSLVRQNRVRREKLRSYARRWDPRPGPSNNRLQAATKRSAGGIVSTLALGSAGSVLRPSRIVARTKRNGSIAGSNARRGDRFDTGHRQDGVGTTAWYGRLTHWLGLLDQAVGVRSRTHDEALMHGLDHLRG